MDKKFITENNAPDESDKSIFHAIFTEEISSTKIVTSGFVAPFEKTNQRLIQDVILWPHRIINQVEKIAKKRRKREQIVRQEIETG